MDYKSNLEYTALEHYTRLLDDSGVTKESLIKRFKCLTRTTRQAILDNSNLAETTWLNGQAELKAIYLRLKTIA